MALYPASTPNPAPLSPKALGQPHRSRRYRDTVNPGHRTEWRARLALAAAVAVGVTLLGMTFAPVTLVQHVPPGATVPATPTWERVPTAVPSVITVAQRGPGRSVVSPIGLRWPEVASSAIVTTSPGGGFRFDPVTQAWVSSGPARLVMRGVFGDATVALAPGTTSRDVLATRGAKSERLSISGPTATLLPSPVASLQRTSSFMWRSRDFQLAPGVTVGGPRRISVGAHSMELDPGEVASIGVVVPLVAAAALDAWLAVILVALILAMGWFVGTSLDVRRSDAIPRNVLRMAMGVLLMACVMNTLAYMMPARWAGWAVIAAVAVLGVVRARSAEGRERLAAGVWPVASTAGWAALPAAVVFFPVSAWGLVFAGEYKTDLYEYSNLSSVVRGTSLFGMRGLPDAQGIGPLTEGAGFAWRSVDSVGASVISSVFGVGSVAGIVTFAMVLFMLFATALLALGARGGGGAWGRAIILLALLAPAFGSLFLENYISHYAFVAVVPAIVLGVALLVDEFRVGGATGWLVWAVAAVVAFGVLVYPYFLVIVIAAVAIGLVATRLIGRAVVRTIGLLAAAVVAVVNIGILTVVNYGDTTQYKEGLDAIARGVLLGPYSDSQRAGLALGLVPYHWREWGQQALDSMGQPASTVWSWGDAATRPGWVAAVAVVIAVGVALACLAWRPSLRDAAFVAAAAIAVAWAAVSLVLIVGDDPYAALKAVWTGAALLPLLLATAVWRPRMARWALVALIPLAVLWLRTDALDRITWFVTPAGAAGALHHSASAPEIAALWTQLSSASGPVSVRRGRQPLVGSDRDRVLIAHARISARDLGLACVELCTPLPETSPCPVEPGPIIVIGREGRATLCGRHRAYAGPAMEIYR